MADNGSEVLQSFESTSFVIDFRRIADFKDKTEGEAVDIELDIWCFTFSCAEFVERLADEYGEEEYDALKQMLWYRQRAT